METGGAQMSTLQTERSLITFGIVLCGAGFFCVSGGVSAWRGSLRFQANAVETVATVIPAAPPRVGLRFETNDGTTEVYVQRRGIHEPVGTKLHVFYVPGDLEGFRRAPLSDPRQELILAGVGAAISLLGIVLLVFGWKVRQRSGSPFWL
jgi:hypothetical protein